MLLLSSARPVLALILLVFLPRALAAQTVADPSFEAPVVHNVAPGYKYLPTVAGATFTGGAGISGNDNAWQFQPAPDGVQLGFLQASAKISQDVTGLAPGTAYAVRFQIAKRPITGANEVTVSFNGLPILKFKPTDNGWVPMTTRAFTAGSSRGTLTFSTNYTGPDDVASGIDMVTVVPALVGVPDASFETPGVGSAYVKNPTVPGLIFTGDAGIAGNGTGLAPAAPFGSQIGIMRNASGAPASIGFDLKNLTPGASYAVRYYKAVNPGQACALSLAINGNTFSTANYSNQSYEPLVSAIFVVPTTDTTGTLTFKNTTAGDNSTCAIDMVAVAPVLPAVIAGPSFEVPDQGAGFAYAPDAAGISFSGSAGIAANGSAWGFAAAPDGDQVAFLQGGSARIAMNVSGLEPNPSGLFPGVLYAVQFQIAQRPGYGINPVTVWIDGTQIGTFTAPSTSFAPVTSLWFTPQKTTGTISFTGTNSTGDTGTAIDMVSVVPVPRVPQ
jgi:Protein of unknown function (DUF642)